MLQQTAKEWEFYTNMKEAAAFSWIFLGPKHQFPGLIFPGIWSATSTFFPNPLHNYNLN